MKENVNDKSANNKLVRKMVLTVLTEFLTIMVFIAGTELAYNKWGATIHIDVTNNFLIEFIPFFKAVLITMLLGRLTLAIIEFRETRAVLNNPDKLIDIFVNPIQHALLHVCILPLGYIIATYTMFDNSRLHFILFVVTVYGVCVARVTLALTTRFYQHLLLDYYKRMD